MPRTNSGKPNLTTLTRRQSAPCMSGANGERGSPGEIRKNKDSEKNTWQPLARPRLDTRNSHQKERSSMKNANPGRASTQPPSPPFPNFPGLTASKSRWLRAALLAPSPPRWPPLPSRSGSSSRSLSALVWSQPSHSSSGIIATSIDFCLFVLEIVGIGTAAHWLSRYHVSRGKQRSKETAPGSHLTERGYNVYT